MPERIVRGCSVPSSRITSPLEASRIVERAMIYERWLRRNASEGSFSFRYSSGSITPGFPDGNSRMPLPSSWGASSAMSEGYLAGLCAAAKLGHVPEDFEQRREAYLKQLEGLRSGPVGDRIRAGMKISQL